MTIFAIIAASESSKVGAALENQFQGNYLQVGATDYLVAASPNIAATAKDLSDKLGITDGTNGSALVLNVAGYYGRAIPNIWEWIAAKFQQVA
jgi:hypothetical protein